MAAPTVALAGRQPVLADILPRWRYRTATLVAGFALLTAALAQLRVQLPWTPVPITGQTLAVVLSGAVLGSRLGPASQLLYVALGAIGLPFYAGGERGWETLTGTTGGYLVGFVVASFVAGALSERGQDRTVATAVPAMLASTATVYLFGVSWLVVYLGVGSTEALELGLLPFLVGDVLKVLLAAAVLPAAWRFARRQ